MKTPEAKITTKFGEEIREACFSPCETFRYYLKIEWSVGGDGKLCNFIGLNPSTATHEIDDPTIRRCKTFAHDWGYRGIVMTNLFAFRATDPRRMFAAKDPVGPGNDYYLEWAAKISASVVGAWGSNGSKLGRAQYVGFRILALGKSIEAIGLKLTENFQPRHPLYLPKNSGLFVWGLPGKATL